MQMTEIQKNLLTPYMYELCGPDTVPNSSCFYFMNKPSKYRHVIMFTLMPHKQYFKNSTSKYVMSFFLLIKSEG